MNNPRSGHQPRKRFGQNFLRDDGVIESIARAISPTSTDHLVEIGPGEGALTAALVTYGCRLDAIELDRDLTTRLLASFSIHDTFTLHSADALKFDFGSLLSLPDEKLRIVGNLPYNISTPLIFKLLENAHVISDMHFMLQKEVVDRLAAEPGSKDWGRLSIMTQYYCDVSHLFNVPPEAFFPAPKVDSAIVRLIPKPIDRRPNCTAEALGTVVRLAFAQRRKTLRNNFKGTFSEAALEEIGIDPSSRAETVDMDTFALLARKLPTS